MAMGGVMEGDIGHPAPERRITVQKRQLFGRGEGRQQQQGLIFVAGRCRASFGRESLGRADSGRGVRSGGVVGRGCAD